MLTRKHFFSAITVVLLMLSFNNVFARVPGNSTADAVLTKDIIMYINQALPLISRCKEKITERDVINTKVIKREGEHRAEEWTVRACKKTFKFTLALSPDGKGGTYITVLG